MEWGGATIGWAYSSSLYEKHTLSGSNSDVIGCYYSSSSSAIVYDVYSGKIVDLLWLNTYIEYKIQDSWPGGSIHKY